MKEKPKDITFHYTNPEMVRDLIKLLPIKSGEAVLDAGSGKNKVWFMELTSRDGDWSRVDECEIEDGEDFLLMTKRYDWIVGNPPFHCSWDFTNKATQLANKGVAWLLNNQCLQSQLTPRRLEILFERGFYIKHLRVVADKRWFGRYYFLIFTKEKNNFISWNKKSY